MKTYKYLFVHFLIYILSSMYISRNVFSLLFFIFCHSSLKIVYTNIETNHPYKYMEVTMPGFTTHYFFGKKAYEQLEDSNIQRLIQCHRQSYNLGLQGPDIFFYYLPAYLLNEKNVGNLMHSANVMDMFHTLLKIRNRIRRFDDRRIADAYICGFMAHYTLDTFCHPYVYFRVHHMKNRERGLYDFGNHVRLETDIDKEVLWHFLSIKPSAFRPEQTILLSRRETYVISRLLETALTEVYPSNCLPAGHIRMAIRAIQLENHMMHDPAGWKKRGVRSIEQMILGHSFISSMIPSDTVICYSDPCNELHRIWCNPWNSDNFCNKSVFDLMDDAAPVLQRRIRLYFAARKEGCTNKNRYYQAVNRLLADLGDCSYNSGFPLSNC